MFKLYYNIILPIFVLFVLIMSTLLSLLELSFRCNQNTVRYHHGKFPEEYFKAEYFGNFWKFSSFFIRQNIIYFMIYFAISADFDIKNKIHFLWTPTLAVHENVLDTPRVPKLGCLVKFPVENSVILRKILGCFQLKTLFSTYLVSFQVCFCHNQDNKAVSK